MVQSVLDALRERPGRRSRTRGVSMSRRVAHLLRAYAGSLSPELIRRVKERVHGYIEAEGLGLDLPPTGASVPLRDAARLLGVTPDQLRRMLRNRQIRRALAWPRPLGPEVLFQPEVLNPATAQKALEAAPTTEPWPEATLPPEWL